MRDFTTRALINFPYQKLYIFVSVTTVNLYTIPIYNSTAD